ncbi:hypothetical protein GOV14_05890 [Candidatus Pacearchaeota archaeon]|nr:hypothetical protein [Candidatus Pacearchaeota archaeon]
MVSTTDKKQFKGVLPSINEFLFGRPSDPIAHLRVAPGKSMAGYLTEARQEVADMNAAKKDHNTSRYSYDSQGRMDATAPGKSMAGYLTEAIQDRKAIEGKPRNYFNSPMAETAPGTSNATYWRQAQAERQAMKDGGSELTSSHYNYALEKRAEMEAAKAEKWKKRGKIAGKIAKPISKGIGKGIAATAKAGANATKYTFQKTGQVLKATGEAIKKGMDAYIDMSTSANLYESMNPDAKFKQDPNESVARNYNQTKQKAESLKKKANRLEANPVRYNTAGLNTTSAPVSPQEIQDLRDEAQSLETRAQTIKNQIIVPSGTAEEDKDALRENYLTNFGSVNPATDFGRFIGKAKNRIERRMANSRTQKEYERLAKEASTKTGKPITAQDVYNINVRQAAEDARKEQTKLDLEANKIEKAEKYTEWADYKTKFDRALQNTRKEQTDRKPKNYTTAWEQVQELANNANEIKLHYFKGDNTVDTLRTPQYDKPETAAAEKKRKEAEAKEAQNKRQTRTQGKTNSKRYPLGKKTALGLQEDFMDEIKGKDVSEIQGIFTRYEALLGEYNPTDKVPQTTLETMHQFAEYSASSYEGSFGQYLMETQPRDKPVRETTKRREAREGKKQRLEGKVNTPQISSTEQPTQSPSVEVLITRKQKAQVDAQKPRTVAEKQKKNKEIRDDKKTEEHWMSLMERVEDLRSNYGTNNLLTRFLEDKENMINSRDEKTYFALNEASWKAEQMYEKMEEANKDKDIDQEETNGHWPCRINGIMRYIDRKGDSPEKIEQILKQQQTEKSYWANLFMPEGLEARYLNHAQQRISEWHRAEEMQKVIANAEGPEDLKTNFEELIKAKNSPYLQIPRKYLEPVINTFEEKMREWHLDEKSVKRIEKIRNIKTNDPIHPSSRVPKEIQEFIGTLRRAPEETQ